MRLNPEQVAELQGRYEAGESASELVLGFGVSRTTVLAHLNRLGITRPPAQRKLGPQDVSRAADLYATGVSLDATARRFGVSVRTLRREFEKAGHSVRPRNGW